MSMTRRLLAALGVLGLCGGALALGYGVRLVLPGVGTVPLWAQGAEGTGTTTEGGTAEGTPDTGQEAPVATAEAGTPAPPPPAVEALARMVTENGVVRGQVLIGESLVIETRDELNGMGPYERASIAAARINLAVEEGALPDDFRAVDQTGDWLVVARDRLVVSVGATEATTEKTTKGDLAQKWATAIAMAMHEALGTKPGEAVPLPPAQVEAKALEVGGTEVGALLVDGKEVIRITSPAPGLTPFERARIVADRLEQAFAGGALPQDIHSDTLYGMSVVKVGETLLITVDEQEAKKAGKTPQALSAQWAQDLASAAGTHYAQASRPIGDQTGEWEPAEPYDDKWVPIVSILEGVKLGLARVNGPRSKVSTVQAVAQLETHWKDYVEIDVYIPISTKVPGKSLAIVHGAAVTGLGDIKL